MMRFSRPLKASYSDVGAGSRFTGLIIPQACFHITGVLFLSEIFPARICIKARTWVNALSGLPIVIGITRVHNLIAKLVFEPLKFHIRSVIEIELCFTR